MSDIEIRGFSPLQQDLADRIWHMDSRRVRQPAAQIAEAGSLGGHADDHSSGTGLIHGGLR